MIADSDSLKTTRKEIKNEEYWNKHQEKMHILVRTAKQNVPQT